WIIPRRVSRGPQWGMPEIEIEPPACRLLAALPGTRWVFAKRTNRLPAEKVPGRWHLGPRRTTFPAAKPRPVAKSPSELAPARRAAGPLRARPVLRPWLAAVAGFMAASAELVLSTSGLVRRLSVALK